MFAIVCEVKSIGKKFSKKDKDVFRLKISAVNSSHLNW